MQALREVELAGHRPLRDGGDLVPASGVLGQQLDHLVGDEGGVDVEDDEPTSMAGQAGGGDRDVDAVV